MTTNSGLEEIYRYHNKEKRGEGFSFLANERGAFLKSKIGKDKKILDIGCRDGVITQTYSEGNTVLGLDIDGEALARAKKNIGIQTEKKDLNGEWKIHPESYDVVVANEVLEHLYYPDIVLKKITSVLKKDGFLIGSIPHAFSLQTRIRFLLGTKKGTPLADPTHITQFSYPELKKLLEDHFHTVEVVPIKNHRRLLTKILATFFPFLMSHMLLFYAESKKD